jgi:hypothetical protein
MKAYWGVDVQVHIFVASALVGDEGSASHSGRFTSGTHWIRHPVSPRTGLGSGKRKFLTLPGLKLRPLGRPTHNQSLYRLSYQGFIKGFSKINYFSIKYYV